MSLTQFSVDNGPHNMDGLRVFAQDGSERIEAFIGRKVMDVYQAGNSVPSTVEDNKVCSVINTMPSASSISRRLSGLLAPSTSAVRRSTASIPLSRFYSRTLRKAARCWI